MGVKLEGNPNTIQMDVINIAAEPEVKPEPKDNPSDDGIVDVDALFEQTSINQIDRDPQSFNMSASRELDNIIENELPKSKSLDDLTSENKGKLISAIVSSQGSFVDKLAVTGVSTLGGVAEDLYNTGVDVINSISNALGGNDDLVVKQNMYNNMHPSGAGWDVTQEIGKFLMAYGSASKAITSLSNPTTKAGIKSAEIGAGVIADFVTHSENMESLVLNLVQKVPSIGPDLYAYLNDPDDGALEKRLKYSIVGVAEGQMAETLFKTVKMLGKMRKSNKALDVPPEVPTDATAKPSAETANKAKEAMEASKRSDLPDTPVDLPELPKGDFTAPDMSEVKTFKAKMNRGEGARNAVDFVTEDGQKVYLNVTSMDTTDDVRRIVSNMVETNPERYAKKKYTKDEVARLAAQYDMTPDDLLAFEREGGLKIGQIMAATDVINNAAESMLNLVKRNKEGLVDDEAFNLAYAKTQALVEKYRDMRSMAGLLLKEADFGVAKNEINTREYIADLMAVYGKDAENFKKAVDGFDVSPSAFINAMRKGGKGLVDRIVQMRYASMLSNPATHVRNIVGGGSNIVLQPFETMTAAMINSSKLRKRDPYGVTFSDAYHEAIGAAHGFLDAIGVMASKIRKGQEGRAFKGIDPFRAKLPQFLADEAMDESQSVAGKAISFIDNHLIQGKFIGKALQFEDNFMKHINALMVNRREAYRKGRIARMSGATDEQVSDIIAKEMVDPSADTLKKMYSTAEYNTFTKQVNPDWKVMTDLADTKIGRLIAPFAKVNLNVMEYTFERMAGINFIMNSAKKKWNSKDPYVRQMARGRVAFTSALTGSLAYLLHTNDSIIGSGPKTGSKWKIFEQAGYQQDSIRIGDTWVEFRRETPMGSILGIIADMAEIADLSDVPEGGDVKFMDDAGMAAVAIIAEMFNPDYLTQNFTALFDAMKTGDVKTAEALVKTGANIAGSFVPYSGFARQFNRQMTEEGRFKRETTTPADMLQTFTNNILNVYAPDRLAMKRNILGEPMLHKHGLGWDMTSPFGVMRESSNKVIQELAFLSNARGMLNPKDPRSALLDEMGFAPKDSFLKITMPPKHLNMNVGKDNLTQKLSLAEYEKLVMYSAGIHPSLGAKDTLEATLTKLFDSRSYKESPMSLKVIMANEVIRSYRNMGTKLLQGEKIDSKTLDKLIPLIERKYGL